MFNEEEREYQSRKKQHLIILTYMKRFINQILKRLSYKKFELVTGKHLEMIGDISIPKQCYYDLITQGGGSDETGGKDILSRRRMLQELKDGNSSRSTRKGQSRLLSVIKQCKLNPIVQLFKLPILQPQSLLIILWESLLLIILLFYLVFTPMKASFEFSFDNQYFFNLLAYRLPTAVFALDIILGFHTGYYELGRVVLQRKLVAARYLQTKFLTDFFCTAIMFFNNFFAFSDFLDIFNLILRIE